MPLYLLDDFVQSTGNDKKKHPDGCPQNGEGQPEGSVGGSGNFGGSNGKQRCHHVAGFATTTTTTTTTQK